MNIRLKELWRSYLIEDAYPPGFIDRLFKKVQDSWTHGQTVIGVKMKALKTMKLSDQLEEWRHPHSWTLEQAKYLVSGVQQLESDSQMLEDLIEMINTTKLGSICAFQLIGTNTCSREAIQAAIKKWKEEKK